MKSRPFKRQYFPLRPPEPMQLLAELKEIFPEFASAEVIEEVQEAWDTGLHCVMRHFTEYFSPMRTEYSEWQLRSLGRLINESVEVDDDLENAISTCMLEHLGQVRGYKALAPYLTKRAKQKTRA